ncbi:hypothetical protein BH11PLA2_BH11PLA2_32800 [soil metagenome]
MAKDTKTDAPTFNDTVASVAAPNLKKFRVSIPKDKLAPTLEVEAETGGDAQLAYKAQAGILNTEHDIFTLPLD